MKAFIALAVVMLAASAQARVYGKCELARDMNNRPFFRQKLNDWVCLVEHESRYDTNAINKQNSDGSWDWGLFQINDRYWCGANGAAGDCHIACNSMMVDDAISASQACVELVYSRHGLQGWVAWNNFCQGQLPNVAAECGLKDIDTVDDDSSESSASSESNSSE